MTPVVFLQFFFEERHLFSRVESIGGLGGRHDATVGYGGLVMAITEARSVEERGHFGDGVAFPLGDAHQERGIFGDGQGARFLGVEVAVVDDEHAAGSECAKGGREERADFFHVPIMQHV